ncbi:MAG: hypothetical protein KGD57_08020 [Candidatus Lokiarchaeota archaeon]|nr:hypothetical protein [Candidatus Lokiarchaeota archaeon]
MSKFERHKKSTTYVYPHKHCKKCEDMIEESYTYCPKCYEYILERKNKKGFFKRIFSRKKIRTLNI